MTPTIEEINAVRAANEDTADTETIAAAFREMTQHVRNTVGVDSDGSSPDLQKVLERYDLLDGSLKTSVDNVGSKSLSAAYDKLIRYMNTHNRVIHSGDVAAIGQLTTTITNTAKAIRPESAEDIQADMDELTGGVKYRDVTADVVAAVMSEDAKRIATDLLEAEWTAQLNDGGINVALSLGDRAALVTALRTAADELEA